MFKGKTADRDLLPSEMNSNGEDKIVRYKWSNPQKPGHLEWIDKTILKVDDRYQRDADEGKVLKLASEFNWPAFGVLIVAKRTNGLFVAEGQHRFLASMKRSDIKKVPCIVFQSDGVPAEAKIFLDANANRKPVSAVSKFKAQLVTKDPIAIHVQSLIDRAGRHVARSSSPTSVACVALLCRLSMKSRAELEIVWDLIIELCRGELIHERLLDALVYIERHLPDGESVADKRWKSRILRVGPNVLMQGIVGAVGMHAAGGARVWASGVLARVNHGLSEDRRMRLRSE